MINYIISVLVIGLIIFSLYYNIKKKKDGKSSCSCSSCSNCPSCPSKEKNNPA